MPSRWSRLIFAPLLVVGYALRVMAPTAGHDCGRADHGPNPPAAHQHGDRPHAPHGAGIPQCECLGASCTTATALSAAPTLGVLPGLTVPRVLLPTAVASLVVTVPHLLPLAQAPPQASLS